MTHTPKLACEQGHYQYWTTSDVYTFAVFNTRSGCEEQDIELRATPNFERWERFVTAFFEALNHAGESLVAMPNFRPVDHAFLRRRLAAGFLKDYIEEKAKRHQALDVLLKNGLTFDEAWAMINGVR
ncbi:MULTISPECIES: hypothetical protein [Burkholderiaceae]|uniref:Uncharacterized protein n=1 Tax=Caballeronia zhejiangensis TaxID=871203 RepID=A0A656QG29_9BURK|nr:MULTISPECIES: hypothetical protein [Burkholderiaceae]KAK47341.1 hypothetical protein BG58_05035 [Caballeronia jiangsuensis]KDR27565.1 hypothetical protein BG60_16650 [Caballeronia zhejiangensis]SAL09003.1 hypothetical protein AWB71_00003 [Caballeronia peredens]